MAGRTRRRDRTDPHRCVGQKRLASGPAAAFTWRLDEATYYATAIELIRANDEIPVRLLLRSVVQDAEEFLRRPGDGEAELGTLLNRLACLAAIGELTEKRWVVEATLRALGQIYDLGFRIIVRASTLPYAVPESKLWLAVLTRVYSIGALAVREADWETVRSLALRRGEPEGRHQLVPQS